MLARGTGCVETEAGSTSLFKPLRTTERDGKGLRAASPPAGRIMMRGPGLIKAESVAVACEIFSSLRRNPFHVHETSRTREQDPDPPPYGWSILKYGFQAEGGPLCR